MSEERNILEMSDEELLALDPSTFTQSDPQSETTGEDPANADPESTATESQDEDPADESEGDSQGQSAEPDAEDTDEDSAAQGATGDSTDEKPEGNEESTPKAKSVESPAEQSVNYEDAYKQLTAPFKANGREIQVKSAEDAKALMQMGANYNKKMAGLKPHLKMLKMLENNGLLSEEKLSYLIDLEKKNPEAISKLIKESGIDPLELDTEKAGDYKPTQRNVDDRELELDAVLDEIQDTDSYPRTLDVVSNKWDSASKNVIANNPQVLKVINGHVQSGVFDQIVKEVESERMFGRLSGLSDIEAYRQVGDAIQARGGFDHLVPQGQQTQPKPVVVQPKPKMGDEGKRREKKLAASSSQPAAPSKQAAEFNPLALSDDEFSKVVSQRFL